MLSKLASFRELRELRGISPCGSVLCVDALGDPRLFATRRFYCGTVLNENLKRCIYQPIIAQRFEVKYSLREIKRILSIKIGNFKLWKMPK